MKKAILKTKLNLACSQTAAECGTHMYTTCTVSLKQQNRNIQNLVDTFNWTKFYGRCKIVLQTLNDAQQSFFLVIKSLLYLSKHTKFHSVFSIILAVEVMRNMWMFKNEKKLN